MYDIVETHHRGLKALGVDEATYSTIVVPSILEKIPEGIRLSITRGKNYAEWTLDEMLKFLLKEIELREDQTIVHANNKEDKDSHKEGEKPGTASVLATSTQGKDEKMCILSEYA